MHILPRPLLALLYLSLTSAASPSPPLLSSDFAMSLMPRHTLFYRQLKDLQTFGSALGGVQAASIMNSGIPDRPFQVEGNNFPDFATAAQRSCDEQFQGCQEMANKAGNGNNNDGDGGNNDNNDNDNNNDGNGSNGNGNEGRADGGGDNSNNGSKDGKSKGKGRAESGLTVNMCDQQKEKCNQAQQTARVQDFQTAVASENIGPDPLFPDFDLICEG